MGAETPALNAVGSGVWSARSSCTRIVLRTSLPHEVDLALATANRLAAALTDFSPVWISLPGTRGAPPGTGGREASDGRMSAAPSASGPVLVVDDDPDIREALADLLEHRGFNVVTAANGAEALALLRAGGERPSVILLDLMMPIMDGYDFLDEQRRDPDLSPIPVAIITAGQTVDKARVAAPIPVLSKPIDVKRLMQTLRPLRGGEGRS
jgi:CheY-like chemotaxis protein